MYNNQKNPLVVIKCITYNHEPYIRDALEGVVMQETDFPFVVIVHDDASTDKTADIIREYAEKYPNIVKPIYETENQYSKHDGSLDRILKEAIYATGAKYIASCEGDDYWIDKLKLQKQVDFLENTPEYSFCYTDFEIKYQETGETINKVFDSGHYKRPENFEQHLIGECYIAPPTWLIPTANYPKDIEPSVDGSFAIALELFAKGNPGYLPLSTAVYRVNSGGVTQVKTVKAYFRRRLGIIRIQVHYAIKYPTLLSKKAYNQISFKILKLFPLAIILNDTLSIESLYYSITKSNKVLEILRLLLKTPLLKKILIKYYKIKGIVF